MAQAQLLPQISFLKLNRTENGQKRIEEGKKITKGLRRGKKDLKKKRGC